LLNNCGAWYIGNPVFILLWLNAVAMVNVLLSAPKQYCDGVLLLVGAEAPQDAQRGDEQLVLWADEYWILATICVCEQCSGNIDDNDLRTSLPSIFKLMLSQT